VEQTEVARCCDGLPTRLLACLLTLGVLGVELAGRIEDATGDVRRLNALLREFFESVAFSLVADGVCMLPVLRGGGFERLLGAEIRGQTPPLRQIRTPGDNPQQGWWTPGSGPSSEPPNRPSLR
jgi:hypothetical protein